jgi:hypothetical protein
MSKFVFQSEDDWPECCGGLVGGGLNREKILNRIRPARMIVAP